jgi:poly [ADP-ribose] polymerase
LYLSSSEFRGTEGVERYKFTIPADLKKKNEFLKTWKPPKGFDHPTKSGPGGSEDVKQEGGKEEVEEEQEEVDDGTPEEDVPDGLEMWGMNVVIAGTKKDLGMSQDELMDLIRNHGGEVYDDVDASTNFFVAPEAEITKKKKTKKVAAAIKAGLPVLSVEYVQNLCERKEKGIKLRQKDAAKEYLVGDTEFSDDKPLARKYTKAKYEKELAKQAKEEANEGKEEEEEKERVIKRKRPEPKSDSDIMKVEPTSSVASKGEILVTHDDRYGYTPYNVMLNVSDLTTGANKFYKMQIIKTKGKNSWTFLIKYGRIGTDAGDQKEYPKKSEKSAIQQFEEKFLEKTGVAWEDRDIFQKKPGKYFMVDIDDGHEDEEDSTELQERKQKRQKREEASAMEVEANKEEMPARLQDFVRAIFDKQMMQKTLESMNFDVKKMPLGKIKKAQIRDAYRVLTEIQNLLESKEDPTKMNTRLKDCANRFYTLIPHDFGRATPPLIDDVEQVKKKMQLLDTLADLEVAASLMQETVDQSDPVLQNYKSLKAKIVPLDKSGDRYKLLESYAYNTHDKNYFSSFSFAVEDVSCLSVLI